MFEWFHAATACILAEMTTPMFWIEAGAGIIIGLLVAYVLIRILDAMGSR
jgi:uncharacterized membrane-anchored protein YhcB (DUF1043 family)